MKKTITQLHYQIFGHTNFTFIRPIMFNTSLWYLQQEKVILRNEE